MFVAMPRAKHMQAGILHFNAYCNACIEIVALVDEGESEGGGGGGDRCGLPVGGLQ